MPFGTSSRAKTDISPVQVRHKNVRYGTPYGRKDGGWGSFSQLPDRSDMVVKRKLCVLRSSGQKWLAESSPGREGLAF